MTPSGEAPTPTEKIRLLVVDDHFVVRIGLTSALNLEPDMEVIAEAKDGRQRWCPEQDSNL